ncbi:MAG: M1 family metallopeptidase [Thermoplasmata archaeon]|nr:M1 family metallopeptidase [Candidatus Sysuiplasma acidicola]
MKVVLYDISLDVDFKGLRYSGQCTVSFANTERTVVLDSDRLDIQDVSIDGKKAVWKYDRKNCKLSVNTGVHRKVTCKISFSGRVLEGGLQGFYKSKSKDDYVLTTQFEPTGARSFIPCIDHPAYKSIFNIRVTVDKGLLAISNTEVLSRTERNGKWEYIFKPTPLMSTYLLYLGIGRFAESSRKDGTLHIIAASTQAQRGKGSFALSNALKFLREYEKFYSIPYPLSKLHLVGVPEFAVGAMENWGSITFREYALLVDKSTSEYNRRVVAIVLAHEIAHQWFGNLVTMKWWNDLWLNESFATYMSNRIVDGIYPEWNTWSDFILSETGRSMHADSLKNTHPIEVKVDRPEEIGEIFDEISYGKGASVLRMIENYLGSRAFRRGVSAYLREFAYGNAESSDLWNALARASGQDIGRIMKSWIGKPGHPLVRATIKGDKIELSQERFIISGRGSKDIWPIPLTYTLNGRRKTMLFDRKNTTIGAKRVSEFLINGDRTGFYRVKYDDTLYSKLKHDINRIGAAGRWGLMSDLFMFLISGETDVNMYLQFARKVARDNDYLIVSVMNSQLGFLTELVPEREDLKKIYTSFCRSHLRRIGVRRRVREDRGNAVLRERLSNGLTRIDNVFAAQMASLFDKWNEVEPELRQAVAISYARVNGENAFDRLLKEMTSAGSDQDAMKIAIAMVSFKEGELNRRALELSFTGKVNIGHIAYMVIVATSNNESRDAVWKWFVDNREKLLKTYSGTGLNSAMVENLISGAGTRRPDEVRDYFNTHTVKEADMGIRKGLELLEAYVGLMKRLRAGM